MTKYDKMDNKIGGRDLSRWGSRVKSHRSIGAFKMARLDNGVHSISGHGPVIDLHLTVAKVNKPLVVFFNARIPRGHSVKLPVFSGMKIIDAGESVSRVCISDPTLALADDIELGWYGGSKGQNLQKIIPEILKSIINRIQPSRILLVGGSGGGFAALFNATKIDDAMAFVWNPQTNLAAYDRTHVCTYARVGFGATGDLASCVESLKKSMTINLADAYKTKSPKFLLIQNFTDGHTKDHLAPFIKSMGYTHPGNEGIIRIGNESIVATGSWGDGHVTPPKDSISGIISRIINNTSEGPISQEDLVKSVAMSGLGCSRIGSISGAALQNNKILQNGMLNSLIMENLKRP